MPPTDVPTPGASAAGMADINRGDVMSALWRVKDRITKDRLVLIAAGVAFFAPLALFPAITALVAVAGLMLDRSVISESVAPAVNLLPESAATIILGQINEVAATQSDSLSFGAGAALLLAIYSASKGTDSLIQGLNVVYEEEEKRGFILLKATVFALTFFLVLMLVVMISVLVVLPSVLAWFGDAPTLSWLADVLRWPFLFGLTILALSVVYRFGPSRRNARWRWIAPGGLLACVLWMLGTVGFALYVKEFGTYNETFGALGGVIILLTWLWLSTLVTLIGALVDAELEENMTKDTTTGPARPPGERGAVKADRIRNSRKE